MEPLEVQTISRNSREILRVATLQIAPDLGDELDEVNLHLVGSFHSRALEIAEFAQIRVQCGETTVHNEKRARAQRDDDSDTEDDLAANGESHLEI